jgi:hypothetical protein
VEFEIVAFEAKATLLFQVLLALMFWRAPWPAPVPLRMRVPWLAVVMFPSIWSTAPLAIVVLAVLDAEPSAFVFWMLRVPELTVVVPV